jgi:transposase-like protein
MESGPDFLTEGYATEGNYRWICPKCFRDLKDEMGWTLASNSK